MVRSIPQVSSLGRYRSCTGVVFTPRATKSGYVKIGRYLRHRVMAIAFNLPRSEGQCTVDHIDGDPSNDRLENLRWLSPSEQVRHSYATNTERRDSGPRMSKPVRGRRVGTSEWTRYDSAMDASRRLNLRHGNISRCCHGRSKSVQGYEFEFDDDHTQHIDGEIWAAYETVHVSSHGRVRNCYGVVSTPMPTPSGYVRIQIQSKHHLLHRVMAIAFNLPRRTDQTTIDHIDGNPSNNSLENLRWANSSEQVRHSYATNTQRCAHGPRQSKPILGRRMGGDGKWTRYESAMDASRTLNITHGNISNCCHHRRPSAKGYEFRYAEPNEPHTLEGERWVDIPPDHLLSKMARSA